MISNAFAINNVQAGCYPGADVFAYPVESRLKQMSRLRACFITIIYLIVRAWATLYYALLPKEKQSQNALSFCRGLVLAWQ